MTGGESVRTRLRPAAAGALLAMGAIAGGLWFAGTETALRWLADRAAAASEGRLALAQVRGSLWGPIHIGSLVFDDGAQRIEGRGFDLDWSPPELLLASTVSISRVALRSLTVTAGAQAARRAPAEAPRLPFRLQVRDAGIGHFVFVTREGRRRDIGAITLRLDYGAGEYRAAAAIASSWGRVEADATLGDAAPFELKGRAAVTNAGAPFAFTASADFEGPLARIALRASASSRDAQAELRAVLAPFEPMPLERAALHMEGIDVRKFGADLPGTDVAADLTLRVQGSDAFTGTVKIVNRSPGPLEASRLPLREGHASFAGSLDALSLSGIGLDFGEAGRFSGAGGLRLGRLALDLVTSNLNLRGLNGKLTATRLAGSVTLDTNGVAQEFLADLREGATRIRIDASHRGEAVRVRSASVSIAGGELALSGAISLARERAFRAEGKFSGFDPSRLGDYPAARINGAFVAGGRLFPQPEAALQFTLADSRYRGHRLLGKGTARISPERLWDADVVLELGVNQLLARGAFGAAGDRMNWRIEADDLSALAADLGGRLRASGTLEGTVAEPAGAFRARARELAWGNANRAADFSIDGKLERGLEGPLALSATLKDYESAALRIVAASITAKGRRDEHSLVLSARNGVLDARATLEGAWRAGNGWSGRILSFENRGRYGARLEAPASLALENSGFAIAGASLRFGRAAVRIDELARREDGWFSSGVLTELHAQELFSQADPPVEVHSTLTLGGRWNLAATRRLNGEIELRREQGDLFAPSEPAMPLGIGRLVMAATIADDELRATLDVAGAVPGAISASVRTTLAREGEFGIGVRASAPLAISAEVNMPSLAWANALTGARMAIAGSLKGRVGAQGTVAAPRLEGSVAGEGLRFEYPEYGLELKAGSLRVSLKENRLVLDRFALRGGEGTLEGSGTVAWEAGKPVANIALTATGLEVLKRLDRHLVLSGRAQATVQDARMRASATLKADRGEIELPAANAPTLSADVVVLGRAGKAARKPRAFAADITVDFDLGDNFHLKGRGIDARLAGAVKVRETGRGPATATGSIRVAQGSYSAYGQRLAIDRGILNFAGPLDDPELDIVAMRKRQEVEAGVAIRGTALAPRISLVSNPAVSDSEKLSWLVLGRGTENANRADLALLQSAAGALLGRGESVTLQNRIAHAVGLDELALTGSGGLEGTVLTLGKRLSSRAYLTFEQGLAAATNAVKIEYKLTQRLSLRAQAGSESAVDAFYTFRFK